MGAIHVPEDKRELSTGEDTSAHVDLLLSPRGRPPSALSLYTVRLLHQSDSPYSVLRCRRRLGTRARPPL